MAVVVVAVLVAACAAACANLAAAANLAALGYAVLRLQVVEGDGRS